MRAGFWITIIAATLIVALTLSGRLEWAVVGLVAVLAFTRLPLRHLGRALDLVTVVALAGLVVAGHWKWALVGLVAVVALRLLPRLRRR